MSPDPNGTVSVPLDDLAVFVRLASLPRRMAHATGRAMLRLGVRREFDAASPDDVFAWSLRHVREVAGIAGEMAREGELADYERSWLRL